MTHQSGSKMVSVCMITYNHEPFIWEAIEGVLMQQTNFPFELVIGEDCSTDRTRAICEEYAENHPEIIRLLPSEKNLGMMPNFIRTLQSGTGKYIALCEGDDYWTDPMKLQKQVEFLEGNEEYAICFHDVEIVSDGLVFSEDLGVYQIRYSDYRTDFTFDDLLEYGNLMHTPSVVFRNSGLFPFKRAVTGDYFLHLHNASFGLIKRINMKWAVYRVHSGGWYSQRDSWGTDKKLKYFVEQADAYCVLKKNYRLKRKHKKMVNNLLFSLINNARIYALLNNDFTLGRSMAIKQFSFLTKLFRFGIREWGSLILSVLMPKIFAKRIKNNYQLKSDN